MPELSKQKARAAAPREFRNDADVIKYLMEVLEIRITDLQMGTMLVEVFESKPELLASVPEEARALLTNPQGQIDHLQSIKQLLLDTLIERSAMASVRKVGPESEKS
jgi:hypothetical protein